MKDHRDANIQLRAKERERGGEQWREREREREREGGREVVGERERRGGGGSGKRVGGGDKEEGRREKQSNPFAAMPGWADVIT